MSEVLEMFERKDRDGGNSGISPEVVEEPYRLVKS